ncbi:MAG: hypothetical protein O7B25_14860, partial [Gammaproteobacteria bacterium]|nr:hypothetical protein [Gammaproteobacteria bacterium]
CLSCHTQAAGRTLGLRTRQLNREFVYPNATDNQLRSWNNIALFSTDIGAADGYDSFVAVNDSTQPLADRARTYLDTNCAICHRPGGPTGVDLDLRFDTAQASMNVIGIEPTAGDLGIVNARIIAAGDKQRSVLWERLRRLDTDRMPPLASHLVDDAGIDVVGRWIDGL